MAASLQSQTLSLLGCSCEAVALISYRTLWQHESERRGCNRMKQPHSRWTNMDSYQLFLHHRQKWIRSNFIAWKKICLEAGWRFQSCESSHRSLRFVFLMWLHPPTPRDPGGPVCFQKSRFSFCWILVTKIFFLSCLVCFSSLEQPGSRFRSCFTMGQGLVPPQS